MPKRWMAVCLLMGLSLIALGQEAKDTSPEKLLAAIATARYDTSMVDLWLRLSQYYVFKPGEEKSDLDSSELFATKANSLSRQLHYSRGEGMSYLELGRVANERRHKEASREYFKAAISLFQTGNDYEKLGLAYQELAWRYDYQNEEITERIRLTELALAAFRKAGATVWEANTLKELADIVSNAGHWQSSLEYLQAAVAIYERTHDKDIDIIDIYDQLGNVFLQMGKYTDALKYGLLAVKYAYVVDTAHPHPILITVYNRLGLTYGLIKDYDESLRYQRLSLKFAFIHENAEAIRQVASNIALTMAAQSKYQDALTFYQPIFKKYPPASALERLVADYTFVRLLTPLKALSRARPYYVEALRLGAGIDKHSFYYRLVFQTARTYLLAAGQYAQVYQYLKVADRYFSTGMRMPSLVSINEQAWFKTDSALGHYRSAIVHLDKEIAINDSLFNEARRQEREQLKIQYETETKDKDIQLKEKNILLLTKQAQLEHSLLQQSRTNSRVVLGGAIALMLLLGLGYNRYRLKQRSNRRLEAQQVEINKKNAVLQDLLTEKEWFLREIHHRVKNNLQIVISLLNIQGAHLNNDPARNALKESQQRMFSMSLIHQKLYQSDSVAFISMPEYVRELVGYLKESFDLDDTIEFLLAIDPIDFDVAQAVPVGLILNEAITNSIKHAFTPKSHGVISVELSRLPEDQTLLLIKDNGKGIPENCKLFSGKSLGMSLMRLLTKQLNGTIEAETVGGLTIAIRFCLDKSLKSKIA